MSRNLIRIWVAKFEAGPFDDDAQAADLIQEYEAKIAALERLVGRQALELEFLKGASRTALEWAPVNTSVSHCFGLCPWNLGVRLFAKVPLCRPTVAGLLQAEPQVGAGTADFPRRNAISAITAAVPAALVPMELPNT